MSSQDVSPKSNAANLHRGNKGSGIFCIPCSNTSPSLQMQKCILHQMPKLIKMLLVLSSLLTVLLRRDDHFHSCRLRRLHDLVRIVGAVRKQIVGIDPFNQLTGNLQASRQSARVPSVTRNRTGIPCASTARCILVLSPLLSGSSPDCRPSLPTHADAP